MESEEKCYLKSN